MKGKKQSVWLMTTLLTITAGYCDAITYTAADKTFSAHITGNFILFACQVVQGNIESSLFKLLTIPVFLLSAISGGIIAARFSKSSTMLFFEGLILLAGGLVACVLSQSGFFNINLAGSLVTMMVVFAMGIQNTFGKLFIHETLGTTTTMTGNSTQFALDVRDYFSMGLAHLSALNGIGKDLVIIGSFLTGGVLGALAGNTIGLTGVLLPGITLVICYFTGRPKEIL